MRRIDRIWSSTKIVHGQRDLTYGERQEILSLLSLGERQGRFDHGVESD